MDLQRTQYDGSSEEEWRNLDADANKSDSSDSSSSNSSGSSSSSDSSGSSDSSSESNSDTSEESNDSPSEDKVKTIDVLCFLDWDDTLFPTNAIEDLEDMTEDERDGLKRVEDKTLALLREADAVGKVIIVTNADNEWVSESKDAMPCVRELLDELRIEVISARERYEDDLDCSTEGIPPTKWKRHVFSEELDNHLTAKNIAEPDPDEFRVVSIGDGWAEFDAARSLGADINEDCLRIWRLADKPGFDTMCAQLQTVERGIGEFAHKEGLQERYEVI